MTDTHDAQLEQVRTVLFGSERDELIELRSRVARLEELVLEQSDRVETVGDVLADAVRTPGRDTPELGGALRPEVEYAIRDSAFSDSSILAEALYPVMGPAMRKMIANLFSVDSGSTGQSFAVEQVMLIHRESGVLLAAAAGSDEDLQEADIVSGMLDAVRMFVQDAFDKPDHDGLQDLRVGDTSVLVEWGPEAVLASVVSGIPTESYRTQATTYLEEFHVRFDDQLESFAGNVGPFASTEPELLTLHRKGQPSAVKKHQPKIIAFVVLLVIIAVIIGIVILVT